MLPTSTKIIAALLTAGLLAACQTQTVTTRPPRDIRLLDRSAIRDYMDRQEAELRRALRRTGIDVTRDGDNLVLNLRDDLLFDRNSAAVKPKARAVIHSLALVLKRFDSTHVNVDGFTDTTGTRDYNLRLSTNRADAVGDALAASGIIATRLSTRGYGENYLKVRTADGADEPRNRRVEITLEPFAA